MGELRRELLPDPASFYEAEGLELEGRGQWRTGRCPLHGGKSLRVNLESGAFVCMAGCDLKGGDVVAWRMSVHGDRFIEAAKALRAWHEDGIAFTPKHQQKPSRLSASDRLHVLRAESLVVFVVGADMHARKTISDQDRSRLMLAIRRIEHVANV